MTIATSDHFDTLPEPRSSANDAWDDLSMGLSQNWIWTALAMQDIRLRYRGSVLGPFWLTLSTVIMVAAIGVIYSRLFHMEANTYVPYLALGLIIWQFVSSLCIEGCQTFLAAEGIIQQVPISFSVHAYRVVFRNLIILAHNAVVIPLGLLIFRIHVDWHVLQVVPALVLLSINGVWAAILFGMISSRFRDIPPIVASLLQVVFFATPIMWPLSSLADWRFIAEFNPAFAAVDVLRAPLLGTAVEPYSWLVLLLTTIMGCVGSFVFFARFRSRIAYWI